MAISPTWAAYKHLTEELRAQRGELAELEMAALERRVAALQVSDQSSVSGRRQESTVASLDLDVEIVKVKAAIAANEDLRFLLRDAVEHGVELVGG